MEILQKVVLFVLVAAVGEAISEFYVTPWVDTRKGKWPDVVRQQVVRQWSGLLGVVLAFELNTDIFSLLGAQVLHPMVGLVLTGLLYGRGSNWIHEFIKRLVLSNVEKHANAAYQVKILNKS